MKSQNTKLNIILSLIIIFLLIYFIYLNNKQKTSIKEGNIGRKIRNTVKSAFQPMKNEILGQMRGAIQQAISPITRAIRTITNQLSSITGIVTSHG